MHTRRARRARRCARRSSRSASEGRGKAEVKQMEKQREKQRDGRCDLTVLILGAAAVAMARRSHGVRSSRRCSSRRSDGVTAALLAAALLSTALPSTRGTIWSAGGSSATQMQSDVIRCNQMQSEVISEIRTCGWELRQRRDRHVDEPRWRRREHGGPRRVCGDLRRRRGEARMVKR